MNPHPKYQEEEWFLIKEKNWKRKRMKSEVNVVPKRTLATISKCALHILEPTLQDNKVL